jgi:transcription antitermination protein NusB
MGKRREGREVALQLLFHWDLNVRQPLTAEDLDFFWKFRQTTRNLQIHAAALLNGVIAHQSTIDEKISSYTANYELKRISAVDRNILRIAIYEMMFALDVPPLVAMNEAIEIAKKFGTTESSKFVNGILDRVKLDLNRPFRTVSNVTE